jgi:putative ABC transport system permease protein
VTGAEFEAGRPLTGLEDRAAARVCVLGANVAGALFGRGRSVGRSIVMGGETYFVVGESSPRKGGFFGENRQDNVVSIPLGTARRLFPDAEATVLYIRAEPGRLELARAEAQGLLRRLRKLEPAQGDDFALTSADQIIGQFDQLSAAIGAFTVGLAGVSLFIGGIGIANVMLIAVTERTREIGVRMAIGARRGAVLRQFLLESALLSGVGGAAGVLAASLLGLLISVVAPGLSAVPPLWIVVAGLASSVAVGVLAGYWPARRAAALDPVEALRYE